MRTSLLLGVMLILAPVAAGAVDPVGITAVVDDQVISTVDLNDRMGLVMGTTGIADTPETRAHLAPQILRQLVDEKLQMQEATRDGITISDDRVKEGIAQIEKQNGRPPGSLEDFLASKGISKQSFNAQVRSQMAWSEIVIKKIRPKVRISDQEVARFVKRKASSTQESHQVMIAAIQLPVDAPENEASVKKLADKLAAEIRGGAPFEAVASQFSSGSGNTKSADAFWVDQAQLDPVLSAALAHTGKGGITDPVRTANGYQIVKLVDMRQAAAVPMDEEPRAELLYKQILMTLKPDAKQQEVQILLQLSKEVAKSPGKCDDKSLAGAGDLASLDFKVTLQRQNSNDMPAKLRDLLMKQKVGSVSEPIITPQGIRLLMLCERMDLPATAVPAAVADDAARQAIYEEKLELEAQKFLRDLRREAFIEIRTHG